jgi:hypothetical protein
MIEDLTAKLRLFLSVSVEPESLARIEVDQDYIATAKGLILQAANELGSIDALMARRPALDKPTRYENIAHAITVAGQKTDEVARLEADVARLDSSLREVRERKDQRITELVQQLESKRLEVEVDNQLIESRAQLLAAIPECPEHGPCIPHALEWIEKAKRWKDEITDMAVVDWSLSEANKDNPKQMVADMIQNAVQQALDPAISADAQKLIDQGMRVNQRVCECEIYQTCEVCRVT